MNFEVPLQRHPDASGGGSFDTGDHGMDIVVPADGSPRRRKDFADPAAMVDAGRLTPAEAVEVYADARAVAGLLDADTRW